MAFSPGKNNLKLLVLFENGVQIWDVKELEMITELRTPLDSLKMVDIDWASSDRVILCGQDGSIRLAGLALAGTSSHSLSYGRDQAVVCPGLLPKQVFSRLVAMLCFQPAHDKQLEEFKKYLIDGLSSDNVSIVEAMFEYWGDDLLDFVLNKSIKLSEKLIVISLALGLDFESEIFQVCSDLETGKPLGRKYDFLVDKSTFLKRQDELHRLHTARAIERRDRMRLTAGLLCLGQSDAAVSMLMEPDLESDTYNMTDQLLACLIQATVTASTTQSESIMKMVATNFVSEGKMWEGVQLLVLIGKVKDACSYLRSGGYHDQGMLVGRCLLEDKDWGELVTKYADHLIAAGHLDPGILALVAGGQHEMALKQLLVAKRVDLAYKMLMIFKQNNVTIDKDVEENILAESVEMMADLDFKKGFDYYCDQLGDKASALKTEFNIAA